MQPNEQQVVDSLRAVGARFAFVHGSRARAGYARPDSDLDIAAWWGSGDAPEPWELRLPHGADLVVLDTAPLWLSGRVAMYGRLLFEDDPAARVSWQGDTRLLYVDEIPAVQERYREWRRQLARGSRDG